MEAFYLTIALVSAGVSLGMGTVFLAVSMQRKNSTYLLFGVMGILLTIFYLTPPIGFILDDQPPYSGAILWKRIFNYAYYGVAPWFLIAYSRYPKKWPAYLISAHVVVSYFVMAFTTDPVGKPLWSIFSVVTFGAIFVFGTVAALWQYRQGERSNARWLGAAMAIFGVLCIMAAINQLSDGGLARFFNMELFFLIHLNSLFFMLMVGQHLVAEVVEKYQLEVKIRSNEMRWHSFMVNTPFIIVELDRKGTIIFINDFGAKLLGYNHPAELINLNWFDKCLRPIDRQYFKELFNQVSTTEVTVPSLKWAIRTKTNEDLTIGWANFTIGDDSHEDRNIMSIGKDITDEEKANRLVQRLKNELLKEQLTLNSDPVHSDQEIVGTSKALAYALQKAKQVALTHASVLLEGETGVGKELFASLIHNNSARADKSFIKVNCGALPKELIEDELFGHEKGAFTSAHQARQGRFELADGGTIFLDEIGELPLDMQPKLLRVLQNGEFERIGGQKTIKVDVRILAATNRNLAEEIKHGKFRSDLYYRLNVFPITIPPLRKRKEDLHMLINYFILTEGKKYSKIFEDISHANLRRLVDYDWPGNIRELKNVIERSIIISDGKTLRLDWWDAEKAATHHNQTNNTLDHIERDHIMVVMEKCHWKINGENGAAEMLAMNPNTLRSRMKRLGIRRPSTEDGPIDSENSYTGVH